MKVNWFASKYIAFTLHFDATHAQLARYLPAKVFTRFSQTCPKGPKPRMFTSHRLTEPKSKVRTLIPRPFQAIVGSLLYYARGVDPTILPALNMVATLQANPTQYVAAAALRLLQYCARNPNNCITFHSCEIVLQSNASYLSRNNARLVANAIFYIGNANHPEII